MTEHNYLAWEINVSGRVDLAWVLSAYLRGLTTESGLELANNIVAYWVHFGEFSTLHYLVRADFSAMSLRNELIVCGERALEDVFMQHPWTTERLVTILPRRSQAIMRKDIYSRCEETTEDAWFSSIVASDLAVDRDVVKLVASLVGGIAPDTQRLKDFFPIAAAKCWRAAELSAMVSHIHKQAGSDLLAKELGQNIQRLIESDVMVRAPTELPSGDLNFYARLCDCLWKIRSDFHPNDVAAAILVFGVLVGLMSHEVEYLLRLGANTALVARGGRHGYS